MKLKTYTEGRKNKSKFFKVKFTIVLVVAILVLYFSVRPVPLDKEAQSSLIPGWDHIFAYFVLASSLVIVLLDFNINYLFFTTIIISFFYGFGIEIIQWILPWRYFSVYDSLLNLIGSSLVVIIKPFLKLVK